MFVPNLHGQLVWLLGNAECLLPHSVVALEGSGGSRAGGAWLASRAAPRDTASALPMPPVGNYVLMSPVFKLESGEGWW